jgi:transposase
MGREPKLTPAVEAAIVKSIHNCSTLETAAALAGVTYRTFRNWMTWGEAGRRPYFQFFQAVTRAETEAEARLVRIWSDAAERDWRASRDMLARRFPERWGRRAEMPPQGNGIGLSIVLNLGGFDSEPERVEIPAVGEDDSRAIELA